MKALVLAAALAALTSTAPAGIARDAQPKAVVDQAAAAVIADAGRLGSASLTSLNGNGSWAPQGHQAETDFGSMAPQVESGTLLIVFGALALARPVSRALRRQEQHRRAAALASTLGHTPRA